MSTSKTKINKLLNLSSRVVPALALSLMTFVLISGKASAATTTIDIPMPIRAATSTEITNSGSAFTTSTSPINSQYDLTNDPSQWGLNLVYIFDAKYDLPTCAQNPQISVIGDHGYSYTGTDTTPWNNPSDYPESASVLYKSSVGNANILAFMTSVTESNLNVNNPVVTSQAYSITAQDLSAGILGAVRFEVIDNISQGGAQFSWEFHGTPTLRVTYDDSTCNNSPVISSSTGSATTATASGTTVVTGASLNASDPDNDTLTYSITAGNDGSYFTIDPSTGNITTTQTGIPAGTYTLTVQVDDGKGGTATAEVTITVTELYCPAPYDNPQQVLSPEGDCDGDGITNQTEGYDPDGDKDPSTGGSSPVDTDNDGIPDYLDSDSDNDGILDAVEKGTGSDASTNPVDTDGDGTPDYRDLDSDGDGISDLLESGIPNTSSLDSDNDGMVDGEVNEYGIAKAAADADDPTKTTASTPVDTDGDGTPNYLDLDSDGDGISDANEKGSETTPVDTDNDGTPNYLDLDSDGDGISDSVEKGSGSTPLDTDGDGIADYLDTDSDNDGISDKEEGNVDTDGDGTPDYLDTDSDNDGISDKEEGTFDKNNNGVPAYKDPTETAVNLANTGANLKLILTLSIVASLSGLALGAKKFSKR